MIDTRSPELASQISNFQAVNIPGAPALKDRRFDWFPPAFYDQGIAYISLTSFNDDLHDLFPETHPSLMWNPTTRTATLTVRKETYVFQPNKSTFMMNNSKMPLSTPPILIRWHSDESGSKLYVPLAPLVMALGGTYKVNRTAHRYRFNLPKAM